jgi:hypothetical protein
MENWPVMIRKRGRWFFSVAGEGKSMPVIFSSPGNENPL